MSELKDIIERYAKSEWSSVKRAEVRRVFRGPEEVFVGAYVYRSFGRMNKHGVFRVDENRGRVVSFEQTSIDDRMDQIEDRLGGRMGQQSVDVDVDFH